jgi:tagatose-1,6-bisphosphate aldolase
MSADIFTKQGKFLMLALDHRESFKKFVNPSDPKSVSDSEVIEAKRAIIDATRAV